jgi:NAD(P)-dependent dehydrogenase (short-subunit alcohol dehydrogenase family)
LPSSLAAQGRALPIEYQQSSPLKGAHIVIVEIDPDTANGVQDPIASKGGTASALRADISKAAEVRSAIDQVIAQHQRLDILVNNAGVSLLRTVGEASEEVRPGGVHRLARTLALLQVRHSAHATSERGCHR